jgi:Putative zinc-finger
VLRHFFHRRAIEKAFLGTLSPRRWAAVRQHLAGCDDCRALYERLGSVGKALGPGGTAPLMRDTVEGAVIDEATGRSRGRMTPWFAGASLLAVAAAVFLFVQRRDQQNGFRPRGSPTTFTTRPPGARLLCVGDGGTLGEARLGLEAGEPLHCPLSASLQIVHSSTPERKLALVVVGVDDKGERRWYAPRQPDAPPVLVEGDFLDLALDWSTRLGVKHGPGRVEVTLRWVDPGPATAAAALAAPAVYELHAALVLEPAP